MTRMSLDDSDSYVSGYQWIYVVYPSVTTYVLYVVYLSVMTYVLYAVCLIRQVDIHTRMSVCLIRRISKCHAVCLIRQVDIHTRMSPELESLGDIRRGPASLG